MVVQDGTRLEPFHLKLANADGVQDFDLQDHLGDGPLVIAFFPLAYTGVCTKEMCDFRDDMSRFEGLGAKVFGFSTDTPFTNVQFARSQGLRHGILSDPNREVVERIWETQTVAGIQRVAKRGVMVLDAEGAVAWHWITDDPAQWIGTGPVKMAIEDRT